MTALYENQLGKLQQWYPSGCLAHGECSVPGIEMSPNLSYKGKAQKWQLLQDSHDPSDVEGL